MESVVFLWCRPGNFFFQIPEYERPYSGSAGSNLNIFLHEMEITSLTTVNPLWTDDL